MHQKVTPNELKIGMFVAGLDRPWMDTPFLLQGFLIEDEEQLAQVREVCRWVTIDPLRSVGLEFEYTKKQKVLRPVDERAPLTEPNVVVHKKAAPVSPKQSAEKQKSVAAKRKPAENNPKSKAPIGESDAERKKQLAISAKETFIRPNVFGDDNVAFVPSGESSRTRPAAKGSWWNGIREGLKELMKSSVKEAQPDYDSLADYVPTNEEVRPSFVPETVQLIIYADQKTVEQELPSANDAFVRTNELLNNIAADIRGGNNLELSQIEGAVDDMVESMIRNPDALMWVARLREQDVNTYAHGLNVAVNMVAFGRHLGYPKNSLAHLGMVGLLLDIGKIKLPRELLEKNARLTSEEFELVKEHVEYSLEILHETPNIHPDVLEGIAQHHERVNGTGYPFNLMGDQISVFGRMAAIGDTFAAVTKRRPYADPISPHEALQMLSDWGGTQFHAAMVEQFIQSIGVFPVGCMVELSTGEVAVIVTHNKIKRLRPRVMIISETDKAPRKYPTNLDLLYDISETPVYIRRGLPTGAYGLDPSEFYLS